jgi:transposase
MSGLKSGIDRIVGIDVSKDKFDACGITDEEANLFQISTSMDRKGFEKLKKHLSSFSVSSVLIGMESTASSNQIGMGGCIWTFVFL